MRIHINLASTPYENARRFYVRWGIGLAALLALTALLVLAAARSWNANHVLARNIADEQTRLAKLNDAEKADIAILNEPQNRDVRERSAAINALIVRKSFSWTRIFSDLEKMMPSRLHVVAIAPQLSKQNQLQIRMSVAGASREKALELVQNLEKAQDFRNPQLVSESTAARERGQTQPADIVTFNIVAQYAPFTHAAERNSAAEKSASAENPASGSTADAGKPAPAGDHPPANGVKRAKATRTKGGRL